MTKQIDHGVFVYRGEFQLPEVAALSASQRATLLLGQNKAAEALVAAQMAVREEPGQRSGPDGAGRRGGGPRPEAISPECLPSRARSGARNGG